jgi:hypothetical protein
MERGKLVRRSAVAMAVTFLGCTALVDTSGLSSGDVPSPGDEGPSEAGAERDAGARPRDDASTDARTANDVVSDGAPTSPYRVLVLADAPLAYWRMGASSGMTVADETGRGNDLLLEGNPTLGAPGALRGDEDTAIHFDGTTTSARARDPRVFDFPARHPFTLEAWGKRATGTDPYQQLFAGYAGADVASRNGYLLQNDLNSTQTSFYWYGATTAVRASARTLPLDQWSHCVATFDGTSMRLYVDGVAGSSADVQIGQLASHTTPFVVGGSPYDTSRWSGDLDEVAVYDHALSVEQIAAHRAAALAP